MTDDKDALERRDNLVLRQHFVQVFAVLRPYFDANQQWAGQSQEHFAYRDLKEHFPELTAQDCFIAVATAKRMVASGILPV
jgi:hypothetical protein